VRFLYLAWALVGAGLYAAPKTAPKLLHVRIPMRDGVHLAANVFLPADNTRFPVILERTPYGKAASPGPSYQSFLDRGYAVVLEDVRGRYESEGVFRPFTQESNDGDDTLNWIAAQAWSNGKIGMIGGSYRGIVQWKAALLNNPHLKAIFPVVAGDDEYRDRFYSAGGAMKLGHRLEWMAENLKAPGYHPDFTRYTLHLPLRTADVAATGWVSGMFQQVLEHPAYDSFWKGISTRDQIAKVHVPVFSVGGWYDNFAESDLDGYAALSKSSNVNRVIIGPWPHNMSIPFEGVDFGSDSMLPIRQYQLDWFDQWLMGKDSAMLSQPPVKIFVMGANQWRDEHEWPPKQARARDLYLSGDGVLIDKPAIQSSPDRYVFDPNTPVPTQGGSVCCNPQVFPWGPMDQRAVELRKDVLVYSTLPLKQDVEVIGPVQAILYVSTSARDTDFTAKLVDVFPDGYARNLTDGILRLRYRNSLEKPELAHPGEVYKISVDAGVTGNVFLKGHRIRLEISSSNFPRFDRNPNTGGVITEATTLIPAKQTIYHDREHPSHVSLMVMPKP